MTSLHGMTKGVLEPTEPPPPLATPLQPYLSFIACSNTYRPVSTKMRYLLQNSGFFNKSSRVGVCKKKKREGSPNSGVTQRACSCVHSMDNKIIVFKRGGLLRAERAHVWGACDGSQTTGQVKCLEGHRDTSAKVGTVPPDSERLADTSSSDTPPPPEAISLC